MTLDRWLEVLEWRNDPLVYAWSKTNRPIERTEHLEWFENRQSIRDSGPIFSFYDDIRFVGTTRLEKISTRSYEVSLIVNPIERGKGYGRAILLDICRYAKTLSPVEPDLVAVVHRHNTASQLLFKAVGFRYLSSDNFFDTFCLFRN
jgi:RimJ/RimL family protein N-acetyltransferase